MKIVSFLTAFAFLSFCTPSLAEPPPGTDPDSPLSVWVRTLKHRYSEDYWGSCCDASDCRPNQIFFDKDTGQYKTFIGKNLYGPNAPDKWFIITQEVLDNTKANGPPPDGHSWVCFYHGEIFCAILPTMT